MISISPKIRFHTRASPLTASPRSAANPANALLIYLYAILEAEARIGLITIGLDPGMGVLHADLKARDSLALDLMEAVRPQVDTFVLELLDSHTFAERDFFKTRQGVCRVLSSLTHRLAQMTPRWAKAVAPVAEAVAQALVRSRSGSGFRIASVPTLLTEANRSAGREATSRKGPKARISLASAWPRTCQECGVVLHDSSRKFCDTCFPERREAAVANFANAGPAALAKRRQEGTDPAHTKEARQKQGMRAAANVRASQEWARSNRSCDFDLNFKQEILFGYSGSTVELDYGGNGTLAEVLLARSARPQGATPRHWQTLRADSSDKIGGES